MRLYLFKGSDLLEENDNRKRRCPKLGHEVNFGYCREPGDDIPCSKIGDCWFETFNISDFIKENYDNETIEKILSPKKPKTLSLLEMIDAVKKQNKKESK